MWAIAPSRPRSDLWRRLWQLAEDLGGLCDDLAVEWVPSHFEGLSEKAIGNRWADTLAKQGEAVHAVPAETVQAAKALKAKRCCSAKVAWTSCVAPREAWRAAKPHPEASLVGEVKRRALELAK